MSNIVAIPFAEYEFVFWAEDEIKLPPLPIRLLHGAFGNALKNSDVCITPDLPDTACSTCSQKNKCDYTMLFKNHRDPPFKLKKKQDLPRPIIFRVEHLRSFISIPKNHCLSINLNLVGYANNYLPRVIDTFRRLGENGFHGKRLRLIEVYQSTNSNLAQLIWISGKLKSPKPPKVPCLPKEPEKIVIRLLTPYQPSGSARGSSFEIRYFLWSIIQRLALLQDLHTDNESANFNFTRLRTIIDNSLLLNNELYWYKKKSSIKTSTSGFLGNLTLSISEIEEVWPWLYYGQWFHVGSRNSFGLGQYQLVSYN